MKDDGGCLLVADWTAGYTTEIDYTHGYHHELKPLAMRQALLSKRVQHRWPDKLRYLELGFGQGVSLNIHAAATGGEFWGCDFNPAQAANARELGIASGANVTILDDSFEELAARTDLPTFDVIALHGIWSWVSEENRGVIVEIARRHLAVGGIFYVSYNALPGWSAAAPLRHLLKLHAEFVSAPAQGLELKVDAALDFAQSLADGNAAYFRSNPGMLDWLRRIQSQVRRYVAHEYFNAHSLAMAFSDMARYLSEAKLSFSAPAALIEHLDIVNLTDQQQKLLQGLPHPILQQSVRDYFVNQTFRRDLWVKGPRPLSPDSHAGLTRSQGYVLAIVSEDVPLTVQGPVAKIQLEPAIYRPVVEALAANSYVPKTLQQLCEQLPDLGPPQIDQALTLLGGVGYVMPTQSEEAIRAAKPICDRLNAHLVAKSMHSDDAQYLASPVVGGGIAVSRFQQLFARSLKGGKQTPAEWAQEAWATLVVQGQKLTKEDRILESPEESIAVLTEQALAFERKALPILRALQVA